MKDSQTSHGKELPSTKAKFWSPGGEDFHHESVDEEDIQKMKRMFASQDMTCVQKGPHIICERGGASFTLPVRTDKWQVVDGQVVPISKK